MGPLFGQAAGRYVFQPSDFKSEKATETLPEGAVIILSLNNLEETVLELDQVLTTFVPSNILPPPIKQLLGQPEAIIKFLSQQAFGQQLKADQLLQIFGLNSKGSIYVAFYPPEPGKSKPSLVLTIPISNHQKISGLLNNVLKIRKAEKKNDGDQIIWEINSFNRDLPSKLFITCSKENMYISTSYEISKSLYQTKKEKSLGESSFFKTAIQNGKNINLLVDINPLKKHYHQNKMQFQSLHQLGVMQMHKLISQIPPEKKVDINFRLQTQFGILSIDEAAQYLEAVIVGGSPHFYKIIDDTITNFQGISLAFDLEKSIQTFEFNIHSNNLKPAITSINKTELISALNYIPGPRSAFTAMSKADPKSNKNEWLPFLDSIKSEFQKRKLDTKILDKAVKDMGVFSTPGTLNQFANLVVQTNYIKSGLKSVDTFKTFSDYLKKLKDAANTTFQKTTLLKGVDNSQVIAFYKENVNFHKKSKVFTDSMLTMIGCGDEDYIKLGSFKSEVYKPGVTKLTIEKGFRLKKGYFGYHEHDVINRQYLYFKPMDDFIVVEKGQREPTELITFTKRPAPDSLVKLLNLVPANTTSVSVQRFLHLVPEFIDFLGSVENSIHKEMNDFIAKVQLDELNETAARKAFKGLDLPLVFSCLSVSDDNTKVFNIFGVLEYPRSKVIPLFKQVFKDVYTHKDKLGGSMVCCIKEQGVLRYKIIMSSEGASHLIRSVVNNFATEHMHKPQGMQNLQMKVVQRNDGRLKLRKAIFFNPVWEPLLHMFFRMR